MVKKTIAALVIVVTVMICALVKGELHGGMDWMQVKNTNQEEAVKEPMIQFKRDIFYSEKKERYVEKAEITGETSNGEVIWIYESQEYAVSGLLPSTTEIACKDGLYYWYECNKILCLDVYTGQVVFENTDFLSGVTDALFVDNFLCLTSRWGTAAMIMDCYTGKTVKNFDKFSSEVYWPSKLEYEDKDNKLIVTFDGVGNPEVSGTMKCYINFDDFSYEFIPGDEVNDEKFLYSSHWDGEEEVLVYEMFDLEAGYTYFTYQGRDERVVKINSEGITVYDIALANSMYKKNGGK